jgi:hypothetical protein
VELRCIEERTEQSISKCIAKLSAGGSGDKLVLGGSGINNLELDMMLNSLKDDLKSYAERIVF